MSRRHVSLRLLSAAALLAIPAGASAQYPTKPPAAMPVKPATIPPFQEATLANGLRLLLVESHRQPVVSLALMLPAGDSYDPAAKEGLASLAATLLTKGAGTRTADQVSSAIEGVGGSIQAASGTDFMTVRANVLTENAPLAFELVADAVARPSFATTELELARTQMLSALQLEQSQPASLADRFFAAHLFGAHPYGKRPTSASVRSLAASDLRAFQKARLVPKGALLVVAGDIALARTTQLAQEKFGTWSGTPAATVVRAKPTARGKTEILLVHRPGSVQSNIVVGNLTYPPGNEADYALTVSAKILGGGSDGRLFKILREQKSWTYGAYSQLTRDKDIGFFQATAEVRNAVTDSALKELLSLERSLGTTPVSAMELDAGKGALVGSLPLQLETAQGLAERVGQYTMLGLPKDFIRTRRPRLSAVTAAQLQAASRTYMRPDQSLIVVVGDGAQIYEKLASIAPTRIVNAQGDAMQPSDLVERVTMLPVDVTKLVEKADSFAVLLQGNPAGYQTSTLAKTADGYAIRTKLEIGGIMSQSTETTFGADLKPQRLKSSGKMQGMDLTTDVSFANGRVKGSSMVPGPAGMKTVTVDTTLAPGVLDDNMIGAVVPGLRWAPSAKFTVNAFDANAGAVRPTTLNVTGTETVTVPAGTFQVYRVEVSGQPPLAMYVTTAAPHRVVKITPVGAPVEFVLVK